MGKTTGSKNYTTTQIDELLDIVARVLPTGASMWETVAESYNRVAIRNGWPERDADSLKKKFKTLSLMKKPTGAGKCPESVIRAKEVADMIDRSIDASDLGTEASSFSSIMSSSVSVNEEEDSENEIEKLDDDVVVVTPQTPKPSVVVKKEGFTSVNRKRRFVDDALTAVVESLSKTPTEDIIHQDVASLKQELRDVKNDIRELRAELRSLSQNVQGQTHMLMSTLLSKANFPLPE